ncbi:uncharacterized protein LAJ45_04628 [Morchella importuna]|uniref:uncharacterized protein n=1 Tax=Morchella importuna TaxID=1174673 RepID=UPI001E8D0A0C|nr:uncharacterized protein LAJ45_04628 [Morchella importuna]KAH8151423.1 hypothetical protein LAJ45_04628 [Morchella importuna]
MPPHHSIKDCVERNRRIQDDDILIASRVWNIWKVRHLGIQAEKEEDQEDEDQKKEEKEEEENKLDGDVRPEKEKKD